MKLLNIYINDEKKIVMLCDDFVEIREKDSWNSELFKKDGTIVKINNPLRKIRLEIEEMIGVDNE